MDDILIQRAARFIIHRRGVDAAKQWAAQQALDAADSERRTVWLRILQAMIDRNPSPKAETPFN